MADNLRLSVEVDDKFSENLKKLHTQLQEVGAREHVGRIKDLGDGFKRARESALSFGETLKGVLEPSMAALGLGAFSVGGAMAGLIEGSRRAGESMATLGRLSAALQLPPQFLRDQETMGKHFGLQAEAMDAGLKSLQRNIELGKEYRGQMFDVLKDADPDELSRIMGAKSPQAAAIEAERYIAGIKDPSIRARRSQLIFGGDDLAALGLEGRRGLDAARAEAEKYSEKIPPGGAAAGEKWEESSRRRANVIASEWNVISEVTLPIMAKFAEEDRKFLEASDQEMAAIVKTFGDLKNLNWAGLRSDLKPIVDDVKLSVADLEAVAESVKALGERMRHELTSGPNVSPEVAARTTAAPGPMSMARSVSDQRALGMLPGTEEYGREHYRAVALSGLRTAASPYGALANPWGDRGAPPSVTGPLTERVLEQAVKQGVIEGIKDSKNADLPVAGGAENSLGLEPNAPGGFYVPGGGSPNAANVHRRGGYAESAQYHYTSPSGAGNLTKLINEASKNAGIDPRIMEGIRAGESGHGNRYDVKDDSLESSWGPFQLNRRRGLGVEFERDTVAERARLGLGDLHDPRTIALQADWVAKYIKRHGGTNGQWMGYHGDRDADPRWGDAGYTPAAIGQKTAVDKALSSKTPAVDRAIGAGAFMQPGMFSTNAEGTVNVHLHGLPPMKKMTVDSTGMFKTVKLNRGLSMPGSPGWED